LNCAICHVRAASDKRQRPQFAYVGADPIRNLKSTVFQRRLRGAADANFTGKLSDDDVVKLTAFIQVSRYRSGEGPHRGR